MEEVDYAKITHLLFSMKIIHKSILKELTFTFFLSLASLNFILMMEKLLRLSRFLSGVGTSILGMTKVFLYLQPQLFLLTIPMALLLSTLLTYGRLNMDNELVILRTSGMRFKGIMLPVAVLGLICFLLNLAVSFYIGPKSSLELRNEIINIIRLRTPLAIEEGQFNTFFEDMVMYVREKPSDNVVRGIFVYDSRNKEEAKVLIAKEGTISVKDENDINLFLEDGYINMAGGDSMTELFFQKYNIIMRLSSDAPARKNAELMPSEIMQKIDRTNPKYRAPLQLELHRRFSLPLLCIVLIFFGPPLAIMAGRSGKLGGLTIGLAVFTTFYMILIYGENLVRSGRLVHYIGAWVSTAILGISALLLFIRESRK